MSPRLKNCHECKVSREFSGWEAEGWTGRLATWGSLAVAAGDLTGGRSHSQQERPRMKASGQKQFRRRPKAGRRVTAGGGHQRPLPGSHPRTARAPASGGGRGSTGERRPCLPKRTRPALRASARGAGVWARTAKSLSGGEGMVEFTPCPFLGPLPQERPGTPRPWLSLPRPALPSPQGRGAGSRAPTARGCGPAHNRHLRRLRRSALLGGASAPPGACAERPFHSSRMRTHLPRPHAACLSCVPPRPPWRRPWPALAPPLGDALRVT